MFDQIKRGAIKRKKANRKIRNRKPTIEQLELRRLLYAEWQNPVRPLDVNNDMAVSPVDALIVINQLNRASRSNSNFVFGPRTNSLDFYPDVNGDSSISLHDVIQVINGIRRRGAKVNEYPARVEGESEIAPAGFISMSVVGLPGNSSQLVEIATQMSVGRDEFNELGFFVVDSPNGSVNGILPLSPNYPQAVFDSAQRQVLYSRLDVLHTTKSVVFPGGKFLAVYVLQSSSDRGDAASHLRVKSESSERMSIGWEKHASVLPTWPTVGDRGYDDVKISVQIGAPHQGNAIPVFANIPNQTIDELKTLSIQTIVMDANLPSDKLVYAILSGPNGATIDRDTGLFRWTPTEAQGPGVFTVMLSVTDLAGAVDTESFTVTVNEVNLAPVLTAISNQEVNELSELTVQAVASDADLPKNILRYSLEQSPSGTVIDASTGLIRWTPTQSQSSQTYSLTVQVTDNGTPSLSNQKNVTVTVGGCQFATGFSDVMNSETGGSSLGKGTVATQSCFAKLTEGDSFNTVLQANFTVPTEPSYLQFNERDLLFATTDNFINDAFEASLVDERGVSLVHKINGTRDAFFNVTEGEPAQLGANTRIDGEIVKVDLEHIAPGTKAKLLLRLVNNDSDKTTSVKISNLELIKGSLGTPVSVPGSASLLSQTQTSIDFSNLTDVTASMSAEYAFTSFDQHGGLLQANLAVRNAGSYGLKNPIIVAIDHISDPSIHVTNADGMTPAGRPYFDFSMTDATRLFSPQDMTASRQLLFKNPNGIRFTYDLVVLGQLNQSPVITSEAIIEASVGRAYGYQILATDLDGDILTYSLLSGPKSMSLEGDTLKWAPTAQDLGNQAVVVRVSDGRGGIVDQRFTLGVTEPPPNRPPVFTSTPVVDGNIGSSYVYNAKAIDSDADSLTYELVDGPSGMRVDKQTGKVTWTPTASRALTWNPARNFSTLANPGGQWSYGWTQTQGSKFNVYPHHIFDRGIDAWDDPTGVGTTPVIIHNGGTTPVFFGGLNILWQPGQLSMHPGLGGQRSVLRWTAPVTGIVSVSAVFANLDGIRGATTDVHVLHNGQAFFDGDVRGHGSSATLVPSMIGVAVGDTIDFVVGFGGNGYDFDTTSVDAQISMGVEGPVPVTLNVGDGRGGSAIQKFTINLQSALGNHDPVIVSAPDVSRVDLLLNGSFESTALGVDVGTGRQMYVVGTHDNLINNWTLEGLGDLYIHKSPDIGNFIGSNYNSPRSGNQYLDLSGGVGGGESGKHATIYQTFATIPSTKYELRFFIGAAFAPTASINVRIDGGSSIVNQTFTASAPQTNINWTEKVVSFVADSTTTKLSFQGLTAFDDNVSFVDDVSVTTEVVTVYPNAAPLIYDVHALDADNDSLSYFLAVGPDQMTIDSQTGKIAWSPVDADVGYHSILVRVEDGRGGSDVQKFTVHVTNAMGGEISGRALRAGSVPNGGFESPSIAVGTTSSLLAGADIGGWTVVGHSALLVETTYAEPGNGINAFITQEGKQAIDLTGIFNSGTDTGISQTIVTVPGQTYTVKFYVGRADGFPNVYNSPSTADLRIDAGQRVSFTNSDSTPGTVNWKEFSFDFTAAGANTQIAFLNGTATPSNSFVGLDNVRLTTAVPGLAGVTVYLDQNQNGQLDSFERSTTTDAQGNYSFKGLLPATYYVTQATQAGLRLTSPADGNYPLNIVGGQIVTGIDFSNEASTAAEIRGMKFNDLNGNGLRDGVNLLKNNDFENGLIGFTTDLISGNVGQLEGVYVIGTNPRSHNGAYGNFGDHTSGTGKMMIINGATNSNGDVLTQRIEVVPNTQYQFGLWAASAFSVNPAELQFYVNDQLIGASLPLSSEVGKWQFLSATWDSGAATSAKISVRNHVDIRFGNDFVIDDLEFRTVASFERGLRDWTIYLDQNSNGIHDTTESSTLTDADGNYSFTNLTPGLYTVAEVPQPLITFDAVKDFSIDANPNSAWSYGYSQTRGSQFQLSTIKGAVSNLDYWSGTTGGPHIIHNLTGSTIPGGITYPPDALNLDPSFDGRNSVLRFNVPATGSYRLVGRFQGIDLTLGTTTDVAIQQNSQTILSGNINGFFTSIATTPGAILNYDLQVTANQGDTIDFSVGQGTGGSLYDSTGVSAMITGKGTGTSWRQTAPETKTHQINVVAGEIRRRIDFGNQNLDAINHSPKLTSTALIQGDVGTRYLYQLKATDEDGDRLKYDLPVKPSGMAIDPNSGIIVWTPKANQLGAQSVIVRVSDGRGGVDLQSFQVLVEALNHPPVIVSQPRGPAVANLPYEYRIRAQDSNGDPITYRLKSAPIGDMTVNATTGVLTWRPTANDIGKQKIDVTATDPDGDGTGQVFELTVVASAPNRNPVFNSSPVERVRLGNNYFYAVDATDLDGDPLTFQLDVKPQGMTIDASGVITWTPSSTQFGDNQIQLRITDGRGGEAVQSFNVAVLTQVANNAPTISSTAANAATLGVQYRYNVIANDIDGDTLSYSLEKSPIGMSIDAIQGAIRWTPTEAQIGPQEIIVKVLDPQGATSSQSFTVTVRGSNLPPAISSVPITTAAIGRLYSYAVRASDPEGSPLTYSLITRSGDMSIDSTGVVRWIPTVGELAITKVAIRVTDSQGASTEQSYSITATSAAPNLPPVITSLPILAAAVNQPYQYRVTATDPDGGPIRFAFLEVPVGMTIDENTGVINWTSSLAGIGLVTVLVSDPDGGDAEQTFEVVVRDTNLPPKITSTPITNVASGTTYRYDIHANDPNNDPLSYTLTSGPSGMSIDSLGRITWITKTSDAGTQRVKLTVSDDRGAFAIQEYDMVVTADTEAPKVRIQVSSNPIALSDTLELLITATDNTRVKAIDVTVDGKPIALDSRGRATLLMSRVGSLQIVAVATDDSGNTGRQTRDVLVIDTTVTGSPVVDVTVPSENATITAPTDIIGTVQDANLVSWKLEVAPFDGGVFKQIATGTNQITNGKIATFDPTMLQNDSYILRLTALNTGGLSSSIDTVVNVSGNLKLGNFSISFTDLAIQVAGIPITVSRTYDTLNANQDGELGFGWKLAFRDVDLRTSLPKTGDEAGGLYTPFRDGTRVYVTLPGGQREGYTFRPKAVALFDPKQREQDVGPETQSGLGFNQLYFVPSFVPDKSVTNKLTVPRFQLFKQGREYFQFGGGLPYNPNDPAYGGRFTLTTKDGAVFQIDAVAGVVRSLTDRNGNTLSYSQDGITSSRGPTVTFARDARGRIIAANGPDDKQVRYKYDESSDLVSVTDPAGNVTSFVYRIDPGHYMEKMIDPLGATGIRTEYDANGRIAKVYDARGNATEIVHDLSNSAEVVVDSLGRRTTSKYDERGNTVTIIDAAGGVTQRTYDESNNELSVTDPLGHTIRKTYDDGGNQLSVTDSLGNVSMFTYDTFGNELTATNPLGNTSYTTQDDRGNILSKTDEAGLQMAFEPDRTGGLTSMTDFGGGVTRFVADSAGHVTSRVDPLGNTTAITYDGNGNPLTETSTVTTSTGPQTLTSVRTYDAVGRVTSVTDPSGAVLRTEYDAGGRVTATIDALGRRTKFVYDERGLLLETNFADGSSTRATYDAEGQLLSAIDQFGRITKYQYDALGRLVTTILPDATPSNDDDNPRTMTEYDAVGNVTATADPLGNRIEFTYDAAGRQVQVRDPLGNINKSEYDAAGRQIATTTPRGFTTRFGFDDAGRPTKTFLADGTTTSITLDSAGRVTAQTDQAGAIARFEYDVLGRLTAVMDALGQRTESVYDEAGRLVKRTDTNGHVTKFEYDAAGRQTATVRPQGERSTTVYDAVGQVKETTDFNGAKLRFGYDAVGRLTDLLLPGGTTLVSAYTPTGKPSKITDSRGDTSYTYDAQDRLLSQTNPDGRVIAYTYDVGGRKTAVTSPSGTTSFIYDAAGHLLTLNAPGNQTTNYAYDADGNVVSTNLPDGTRETRSYDMRDRLLVLDTSGPGGLRSSFHYTINQTGRRTAVVEAGGRRVDYTFDVLGRLTKEAIADPTSGPRTIGYTYDPVGNRLTRTDSAAGTSAYTYDPNDQLLTEVNAASVTAYTYDANGNLLTRLKGPAENLANHWDELGRLVGSDVTDATGTHHIVYAYDAAGNRVTQTNASVETRFLVDTNRSLPVVIEEYTPGGLLLASYVYGNNRISQTRSGVTSIYHADGLGSVRQMTSLDGAVTDQYTYDAFGLEIARTGSTINPYRFTGEPRDPATGLDYLRARYYDPALGRFASTDPFAGIPRNPLTLHRYLYAGADPVNRTDPTGRFFGGVTEANAATNLNAGLRQAYGTYSNFAKTREIYNNFAHLAEVLEVFAGVAAAVAIYGGLYGLEYTSGMPLVQVPGVTGGVVLYRHENKRSNAAFPKVEVRNVVNLTLEDLLTFNFDGPSIGKVTAKFGYVLNLSNPSKSAAQFGANYVFIDRKVPGTSLSYFKFEFAVRDNVVTSGGPNVEPDVSIRFGFEATFLGFGKYSLTVYDSLGNNGLIS
ncbi:MAG: putative Ig domain-containing protein [Pirellulaceae bacterium]|nr:putative Ig domain-containing protein [Pirellulaceae bacterium]